MKYYLLSFALVNTACGATELPQNEIEKTSTEQSKQAPQTETAWSLKAASLDKLPECTEETEGRLAWVVSEKTAYACSENQWIALDLRGTDGKDGEDGKDSQSIVGEKGEKGEKGDKGDIGAQGEQGQTGSQGEKGEQGEQGEQGIAGAAGNDGITTTVTEVRHIENLPKARDAQGVAVGDVIYYDTSRSHFIAVTPMGLRLRFTSLGGMPAWTVYYKTANCSDTPMVLAEPYFFETTFITQNGLMVKDGLAATQTAAYRKRDGMACELAPSVVTARMFSLRAPTTEESVDLWSFGSVYVD